MTTNFTHIAVPVDFGPSSQAALEVAIDLAKKYGAKLTLLHVYEIPSYGYAGSAYNVMDLLTPVEDAARAQMKETLAALQKRVPGADGLLRRGDAASELLTAIGEAKADLVVMGTHGREGVGHVVFGSVAEKIVRRASVPVLTVRGAPPLPAQPAAPPPK